MSALDCFIVGCVVFVGVCWCLFVFVGVCLCGEGYGVLPMRR